MMDPRSEELDQINSAIEHDSKESWRYIYNRYYGAVKQKLYRCSFTGQDAEDLAQRTFIKIYGSRRKPHFNDIGAFYSWLLRTVQTVVYDELKSRSSKDLSITEYVEDMDTLIVDVPDQTVTDGSANNKINNALKKLTEKERNLVVMRADGNPYKPITEATGIPLDQIRVYRARAAEKFRKFLLDEGLSLRK